MLAVVLSIGDELVLGQTVDTNSAWLSSQLAELGIGTSYHQTVSDDRPAIELMIRRACEAADLVIVSGGIGPTDDDLTRQALSDAMRAELILDEKSLSAIKEFFTKRGRPMSENNRVQAMHPAGSVMIDNSCGTAPGIMAKLDGAKIFVVPGVPREMKAMYEHAILPELTNAGDEHKAIVTTKINSFGIGESNIALLLGDMMNRDRNPIVGTTANEGMVGVRIRSEFDDPKQAQAELEKTVALVKEKLGVAVYGRDEEELGDSLVKLLIEKGLKVATAESCTGGLVGKSLTDVAGSSEVYVGGFITYSNDMKVKQLGVDENLIIENGVVSAAVVKAMACGAIEKSGADIAIGISGVAGPGGGSKEKPVGTVWIGLAWRDGGKINTRAFRFLLPGHRQAVRERASGCALQIIRLHVLGVGADEMQWARVENEDEQGSKI